MFAGQVMVGALLSFTATMMEQVSELPAASVAVTVTVLSPTGKVLPLGWL